MTKRLSSRAVLDDPALLALVTRKDPGAVDALYGAYFGRLRATTIHFLGHDDPEGEDLVQETFLVALKKLPSIRIQTNLYGWLNRVCTLLCYERLRQRKRLLSVDQEGLLDALAPMDRGRAAQDEREQSDERAQALRESLQRMDERCRSVIQLRHIDGLSYAAISKKLKIPMGTVMSRLKRCREALAVRMQRQARGRR